MNNKFLEQIKCREFNKNMLYSLYNILEDTSCLIMLSSNLNENFSVDDFEWLKLDIEKESTIQDVYFELKHYIEKELNGLNKGIFIIKKDNKLYCIKLISFDVNNL